MILENPSTVQDIVDAVYRTESRRVLATLIRLLGDFELAEDAMLDAFAAAVERWPRDGMPTNPRSWLISAVRFKAIDVLRRKKRFETALPELARQADEAELDKKSWNETFGDEQGNDVEDDRLRLIFTCCHPALPLEAQLALTLREVCGLTTEEIAASFLTAPATLAQRIVRAKAKIRTARIPYQIPTLADLPDRLDAVLRVIYLVFTEGYSASSGETLTRSDLSSEAIRLGRLLLALLPKPEVMGLLALMLLHESRHAARTDADGDMILLDDQDRSLWNTAQISEGAALVESSIRTKRFSVYTLQAAIAAVHAQSSSAELTDWTQIAGLYSLIMTMDPSPVVALNHAVAIAMRDGPQAGMDLIDGIVARGDLEDYYLAHSVRADLCRRLGRAEEAKRFYHKAMELARLEPERRFLQRRIDDLDRRG